MGAVYSQDKYQRMLTVVNQYPDLVSIHLSKQFKKLRISRFLAENALVFLLQYSGLMITTLISHPSPLWFASGTSLAFIFLRGISILPGIWLGSFLAYILSHQSLGFASFRSALDALQAFLILWLSYRYVAPTLIFYTRKLFIKFVFLSLAITALTNIALMYAYSASWQAWIFGWLASFNGILIFATAIVAWDAYFTQMSLLKTYKSTMLWYGVLLLAVTVLLCSYNPLIIVCISLAIMTIILFMSIYLGWCGSVAALFLVGLSLGLGAYLGVPIYQAYFSIETIHYLQKFLVILGLSGLFLAIQK